MTTRSRKAAAVSIAAHTYHVVLRADGPANPTAPQKARLDAWLR